MAAAFFNLGSFYQHTAVNDRLGYEFRQFCIQQPVLAAQGYVIACGLMGRGIGYVDLHLLTACQVTPSCKLWNYGKRLAQVTKILDIAFMA